MDPEQEGDQFTGIESEGQENTTVSLSTGELSVLSATMAGKGGGRGFKGGGGNNRGGYSQNHQNVRDKREEIKNFLGFY